jgi:hypothetical protein
VAKKAKHFKPRTTRSYFSLRRHDPDQVKGYNLSLVAPNTPKDGSKISTILKIQSDGLIFKLD